MSLKNPYSRQFGQRIAFGRKADGDFFEFLPDPKAVPVLPNVPLPIRGEELGEETPILLVAHFWAGLNVKGVATWSSAAVRDFVARTREKQWPGKGQGASIGELKGAWAGPEHMEYEDSVQVMLINYPNLQPFEQFKQDMFKLAERLRIRFRQYEVWAIIENNGVIATAWRDVSRATARKLGYPPSYHPIL